jgi:RNA polymerase sigma-70 factor (ECF subfamily)
VAGVLRSGDARDEAFRVLARVEARATREDDRADGLVRRWRAGDQLAFAELYVLLYDRIRRYLAVALKNEHDAEEVAQSAFIRAMESLPGYEAREPFRAWLFTIARNQAIDHLRKHGRVTVTDPSALQRARHAAPAASGRGTIEPLVAGLSDAQRRVVTLRYVYEFRFVEIAKVLGSSPEAVRRLHMKALRRLGAAMSAEGVREGEVRAA